VSGTSTVTIDSIAPNAAVANFISPITPGEFKFKYEIAAATCSSKDTISIFLWDNPDPAVAGDDQYLCQPTTFTMDATPVSLPSEGTWNKIFGPTGETGSFNFPNNPDAIYTPVGNVYGTYVFEWNVANGGCGVSDQVRIENYQNPSPAFAGPDQDITCDTIVTMAATNPAVGTGNWNFVSKTGDAPDPVINSVISYNTTITGLGPQSTIDSAVYVFEWFVFNGPVCDTLRDTVEITVFKTPTPAVAGDDQELCNETTTTLNATDTIVGTGTWTQVSPVLPTVSFTNKNQHDTEVTGLQAGITYEFKWTTETAYCTSEDTVVVVNYAYPSSAQAMADTSICLYEDVTLSAVAPASGSGTWSQISGTTVTILNPMSFS